MSGYSVVIHFRTDRSATLLFKFKTLAFAKATAWRGIESIARSAPRYLRERDFINRP
jgi:hypothetical protein